MSRVPCDLRWPSIKAADKRAQGVPLHNECRRKHHRYTRNEPFGHLDVRDDLLLGLYAAGTKTCQGQRGGHEFQERAAVQRCRPLGSLPWEFPVQHFLEFRRPGKFFEAAPVLLPFGASKLCANGSDVDRVFPVLAHQRWQIEQSVSCLVLTEYSFTSFSPNSSWFSGALYFMLKTSDRGRIFFSGARWQSRHHAM